MLCQIRRYDTGELHDTGHVYDTESDPPPREIDGARLFLIYLLGYQLGLYVAHQRPVAVLEVCHG
jgi:hypothetical protein